MERWWCLFVYIDMSSYAYKAHSNKNYNNNEKQFTHLRWGCELHKTTTFVALKIFRLLHNWPTLNCVIYVKCFCLFSASNLNAMAQNNNHKHQFVFISRRMLN